MLHRTGPMTCAALLALALAACTGRVDTRGNLADPEVMSDHRKVRDLSIKRAALEPTVGGYRRLVALWREALLARAVLRGKTAGYRRHPQLHRFLAHAAPRAAISAYLGEVHLESLRRGYAFDRSKIGPRRPVESIAVMRGQIEHE